MKEIKLTQGRVALVDDEDFERLNEHKWNCSDRGYAVRNKNISNDKRTVWRLHWDIIGKPKKGFHTDHVNGNGLDNRRDNLRICSKSQNAMNRSKQSNNKSGYKGVFWNKLAKKWIAQIRFNKKQKYLGSFSNKIDAAKSYDKAAMQYHKEFAKLNKYQAQ